VNDLKQQVGEPAPHRTLQPLLRAAHISSWCEIALSAHVALRAGLFFRGALKAAD